MPLFLPLRLQAGPEITEFLASNERSEADEDGDRSDWIEIHNPEPTPISLEGYYLTDDRDEPAKWRFPEITLNPDQYLVVFASRKDRAAADSELHTNFVLRRTGEYLALINPDGRTIASEIGRFEEQFTDVSYGITGMGEVPEGFFSPPTPGRENGRAEPSAGRVTFSHNSQSITENVRVALTTANPEATIRYTTDGSLPTARSQEYDSLIPVSRTMQVRARAFAPGAMDGPVQTETYFMLAEDLVDFTSDIPLVVIDSLGGGIPPESGATNFKTMVMAVFEPKENGRSSLLNAPDLVSRVGVRKRGSSTAGWPKYSMRLETWDEFDEDREVRPFGLPAEADWVLSGRYDFDRALIRNPFMYALSNQIGRYAARTQFVEVIHDVDRDTNLAFSDYFGVYTFMEQLKRDPNRINIAELHKGQDVEPEVTGGYILKIDRSDPGGGNFTAGGQNLQYNEPDASVITARQRNYLTRYINEMAPALTRSSTRNGYQAYIDSGAWIDEHILRTLTKDPDGLRLSTYLFKDRGGKLAFGPIWDFDRTIGCDSDGRAFDPRSWAPADYYFTQTWWNTLLGISARDGGAGNNPDFWQEYKDRWHELRQGRLSVANMHALIDDLAPQIAEAQRRNFRRWGNHPNGGQFAGGVSGWEGEVEHMKGWLKARVEWMDSQWLAAPVFNQHGGAVPEGFALAITTLSGSSIYTTDGTDPRARGGGRARDAERAVGKREMTAYLETGADCKYLVPSDGSLGLRWTARDFDDAAWADGRSSLGWDASGVLTRIATDLEEEARGTNSSFYTRFRFDYETPLADVIRILLKVKFDDGFVAYLNGVEVASVNRPEELSWDSRATDRSAAREAQEFSTFDISGVERELVEGTNVLAVHALNTSPSGSDMFIAPELEIEEAVDSSPVVLTETTTVTARAFDGRSWSAPTVATFVVGAVPPGPENLAITEIMFRPPRESAEEAALGFTNRDLFEFVELTNIGSERIALSGVSFTDGILFDFGTSEIGSLDPGERVLVVRDRDAFEARYGSAWNDRIAGEFAGGTGLENGGERIVLLGDSGSLIHDFTYDDDPPWPEATRDGFSLVLAGPGARPDYSDPASWRASASLGGSPGSAEPFLFAGDPAADLDGDGLSAFMEHAIGTSDQDPSAGPGLLRSEVVEGGVQFSFQRSDTALHVLHEVEISRDLLNWERGDGTVELVSESANGDETSIVTYRTVQPQPSELYWRLRATLQPPATNLAVTEIMYRPAAPTPEEISAGFASRSFFEFIELTNIGATPIDLREVSFVDGIVFHFADGEITMLDPEERVLVVNHRGAFAMRYGDELSGKIAGEYGGDTRLDDDGENLRLVGPGGILIRDFRYNDAPPWPAEADGAGFSLVLIDPPSDPDHGNPENWSASATMGGDPGS